MNTSDIRAFLGEDWNKFNTGIMDYLSSGIELLNSTNENLLANSGKQLRPMLCLLMARACSGAANEDTVRYAIASELLHNATLLHDDVADESDMRRGKPTLRALMGPSASVLVGDFWLVRAMRAILNSHIGRDEALDLFSDTLSDLAEGEMLQLQKAKECDTSFDDYLRIIYNKTASLFVAAVKSGAVSAGADKTLCDAAGEYGKYLGYAFQIRDDIFDYAGDESCTGKALGVDIMEHKITLPMLGALESLPAGEQNDIRQKVAGVTLQSRPQLLEFVRSHGGIQYAQSVLEDYVRRAIDALEVLGDSKEKELLCAIADYVAIRER